MKKIYVLETGDRYTDELKTRLDQELGANWMYFNDKIPSEEIKKYVIEKNSLDVSILYENFGFLGNNCACSKCDFIREYNLDDWAKNSGYAHYFLLTDFSRDDVLNCIKNFASYQIPWASEKFRNFLSIEELVKYCPNDEFLPDSVFPFKKLSDQEIFLNLPELKNQTGNRTTVGISAIRKIRISSAPKKLSDIRIIEKSEWKSTGNQIKIGQTNGPGGRCKYAVFLDWKN